MSDNPGNVNEEYLENTTNIQPESFAVDTPPTQKIEIVTPIQENENIDVKHTLHPPETKNSWKSYAWEFLMLFLAVFCGFLAQNFLEHRLEKERATNM